MANERIEQLRELAVRQLESIREIAGADLQGTSLELELQMAIAGLKNSTTSTTSISTHAIDTPKAYESDEDSFDPYEDEYSYADDYDEDVDDYEVEELTPVVPNNFPDEEAYQAFLREQNDVLPTVEDAETGETETLRPYDVAGVVATENGFVEVGDLEGSMDKTEEILREQNTIRDEYGEELYQNEIEEVPEIRVAMTRTDKNNLTEHQVRNIILAHPSSRTMIQAFGEDYRVVDSDDLSEKIVLFRINNNNDLSRKASQGVQFSNGVVQFAGHLAFPGIGRVYARALVD